MRATLAGLTEAVRPEGDTEVARATVPAKPLRLERVIVEVFDRPVTTVRLDGDEMLKSVTFTDTLVEWDSEPLVATMVTVYVPLVVELTVRVEVPVPPLVRVTLAELRDAVRPEGETVADRDTVPAKL